MSSLALMRWLESAPDRYDVGMRWITLGRVEFVHNALADAAVPTAGARVLEIGCGTGAVTARLVDRGAQVTALDQNPEMLEQAKSRLGEDARVSWLECTASEVDGQPPASFDAVVASLCLSEMSRAERAFVFRAALRAVRPDGRLVVADEVVPRALAARGLHALLRLPQSAAGWLLTGGISKPIRDLSSEIAQAGFRIRSETRWLAGSLAVIAAEPCA